MNKDADGFLYWYVAQVVRVIDGDTVDLFLDLGCNTFKKERVRLYGINAWELRGQNKVEGIAARDWLAQQIEGREVMIKTHKDKSGKFGRLLAEIYQDKKCINDELVHLGHAIEQVY